MAKTVTVRIDDKTYETFVQHAEKEKRSLGKFIEHAVMDYAKRSAFADDDEMKEILSDEGLVRRLKQGIRDAKKGEGEFIE